MNNKQSTERLTRKTINAEFEKAVSLMHGLGASLIKENQNEKSFYYKAKELIGQENINKLWDAGLRTVNKETILSWLKETDPKFYKVITSHSERS